jgi:DnaJ like chaperone protein
MDLREQFLSHTWWGKLIGAFFGFLIAGPIGAFFGLFVGNFFDRGLTLHFSHPFWAYNSEKSTTTKATFFEATFAMLGLMAKADGNVSQAAIDYTNNVMVQMTLNKGQIASAQHWFHQGKSSQCNVSQTVTRLYQAIHNKPTLIHLFVETLYNYLKTIGVSEKKVAIMNEILTCLQLAPLYQNHRFHHDFSWYTSQPQQPHYSQRTHNQSQHQSYRQPPPSYRPASHDSYKLLEIPTTATKTEVKRAYRRQISRYHPDKLIAQGASANTIKAATEKTQLIRKAYESICALKGW